MVEPLECGAELLPDELSGPQSFSAVVPLLLAPLPVVELGLVVLALGLVVLPELLEPGLLAAALLPGGQSLVDMLPEVPDIVPPVAVLLSDLPLVAPVEPVAPVVPVVCAIAAVARVSAVIDAAVRRRRFIPCPPFLKMAPAGAGAARERLTANRGLRRPVPIYPESGPAGGRHALGLAGPDSPTRCKAEQRKRAAHEVRPKFREEKPEGLAVRSGGPARTARSE